MLTRKRVIVLRWRACRGPNLDWWLLRWTAVLSNVSSYANARHYRCLTPNKMLMFANYETFHRIHLSPETAVAHHVSGHYGGSCAHVHGPTWGSRFPRRTVVSFDFTWRINLQGELFSLSSGNEAGGDWSTILRFCITENPNLKLNLWSVVPALISGHEAYVPAFSMQ